MPRLVSMVQDKDLVDCWRSRSPPLACYRRDARREMATDRRALLGNGQLYIGLVLGLVLGLMLGLCYLFVRFEKHVLSA